MSAIDLSPAIDLAPFCGTDKERGRGVASEGGPGTMVIFGLKNHDQPFSRGDYTYATNGHVIVRVPRRDEVPEQPKAPLTVGAVFYKIDASLPFRRIPRYEIPEAKKSPCIHCFDGFQHDCPNCECECEECDGTGTEIELISVALGPAILAAQYVKLLQTLPDIKIAVGSDRNRPMHFTFDGGDGLLMPMSRPYDTHVKEPTS
jgi:hypothetical protein